MIQFAHYKKYNGRVFNRILGDKKLFLFTNKDEQYNGFQYKDGLNIDHLSFGIFSNLCFVDEDNINDYLDDILFEWIREVTIPSNARVYIRYKEYNADKFVLGIRKKCSDYKIEKHRCLKAVKQD